MDDFDKSPKYDLRDTQISDSNQLVQSRLGKQQDHNQEISQTNIFYHYESQNNTNQSNQNSIIHQYQSFESNNHQVAIQFCSQKQTPFKLFETPLLIGSISYKIISQNDTNLDFNSPQQHKINQSRNYSQSIQHQKQQQHRSQEQKEYIPSVSKQFQEDREQSQKDSSDLSDSEQLFSQKISLIRGLEKKLQSLHEKLKIQPNSTFNDYFNNYKVNLQRQYEIHQYSLIDCLTQKPQFLIQKNLYTQSQNVLPLNQKPNQSKIDNEAVYTDVINQSIQSEELLIDEDFRDYERFAHTVRPNQSGKLNKPSLQIDQAYKNQTESQNQKQPKILQIIRIVQVPYLIEVTRENDDKIQSKKSFYFEENQELHKKFQEFTEKQNSNQIIPKIHTKIGSVAHRVQKSEQNNEFGGHQMNQDLSCQKMMDERSLLSLDESNKTFHKMIKQRIDQISFNNGPYNEILSRQFTRCDQKQTEQLEQKLKCLQLQNTELKHKLSQFSAQIEGLQSENVSLWQQLKISEQQKTIIEQKLFNYKQKVQSLNNDFAQAFHAQKHQIRCQYEEQLQQYETQQSEYASRIICFEQLFYQKKEKQKQLTDQIERRNQTIHWLQQTLRQKCTQVQRQIQNRNQVEQIIVKRQNQLKQVIENMQKQNSELKNVIGRFQQKYEEQGFYILKEQAEQLKKTIQQKDLDHLDELEKVQNRYNLLIQKYQTELQSAKLGLQKVRLNKSTSVSLSSNMSYSSVQTQQFTIKKRSSIRNTHISNSIGISTSFENSIKSQAQVLKLSQLGLRHAQTIEKSQNEQMLQNSAHQVMIEFPNKNIKQNQQFSFQEEKRLQNLFLHQIDYLNEQNNKNIKLLQRQRQENQVLSKKILQISSQMAKFLKEVHDAQIQCKKNEQVFQKCVEQLEKQYIINQKLKNKLLKYEQTVTCSQPNIKASLASKQLSQEAIKVHPIYISLSKKYNKSIKYAKILQTQLKELTSLPEFRSENGKCCKDKEETISRLKSLFSSC